MKLYKKKSSSAAKRQNSVSISLDASSIFQLSELWRSSLCTHFKSSNLTLAEMRSLNVHLSRYSTTPLSDLEAFARDLLAQPLFSSSLKYLMFSNNITWMLN